MSTHSEILKYGLTSNTIQQITNVFTQYAQLEKAVLYGSRAKGNYRNGSDIDLTLMGTNLIHAHVRKIEDQLDDLLLPYSFDLCLFQNITNPDLLEHIDRVGIVFYKNDALGIKNQD